jgi:hypothetical protein
MFEPFLWSHLQNLGFSRDFERRVGQIDGECQQKKSAKKEFLRYSATIRTDF